MQELTIHAKLKAEQQDVMGYITYVFEDLNCQNYDTQFIMCVRFPNWNHSSININDVGYLNIRFVEEGIDKWFDGVTFNTYKYTNCIFMKFVKMTQKITNEIIVD